MLFSYDFTNVASAADVVADLQARLRDVVEMKREADWRLLRFGEEGEIEKLKIKAHILLLSEELDFVFDAIKLAQDKLNTRSGQNSALLLHASSSEISWRMLDRLDQLIAKLAVRDIDFHWLTRQDSSIVNNMAVGDLQAFDGAADAEWTEILSKFEEKSNHPLVKVCRNILMRICSHIDTIRCCAAKGLPAGRLDCPTSRGRHHHLRGIRLGPPSHEPSDRHPSRKENHGICLACTEDSQGALER